MKLSSIFAVGIVILTATPELRAQTAAPTLFEQRVTMQAERKRKVRTAGGDFDDKSDMLSFDVKLTNTDIKQSFERCKATFYVFGKSIIDPRAYKLVGKESIEFSLAPRGVHAFTTAEVVSQFDTTGARFGARYDGWVFIVRDETDNVLMRKGSTATWLPVAEKLHALSVGTFYDKALNEMKNVR